MQDALSCSPARPDGDSDMDLLIEASQDCHEAVDGEAAELSLANSREIGSSDAGDFIRLPNPEVLIVEHADDPRGQYGA